MEKKKYDDLDELIGDEELDDEEMDIPDDMFDVDPSEMPSPKYIFHCKPCFNFQTIEFDFEGDENDIPEMMKLYAALYKELAKLPINPVVVRDPPTEKQIEILKRFDIPYNENTITKKEAQRLITESMNK